MGTEHVVVHVDGDPLLLRSLVEALRRVVRQPLDSHGARIRRRRVVAARSTRRCVQPHVDVLKVRDEVGGVVSLPVDLVGRARPEHGVGLDVVEADGRGLDHGCGASGDERVVVDVGGAGERRHRDERVGMTGRVGRRPEASLR